MLVIEVRSGHGCDEELRAVCVCFVLVTLLTLHMSTGEHTGSRIGHGEQERLFVLLEERLIFKLCSVDGLATSAITSCKVTTLFCAR